MRYGRTHDILTSSMFPKMKKKKIRDINHEIDNPSIFYKQFRKSMGFNNSLYRVQGINYNNHRKHGGHDMSDLLYYHAKYGNDGVKAFLGHTFEDMWSDYMLKYFGSFTRNVVEDGILEFSRKKYKTRRHF